MKPNISKAKKHLARLKEIIHSGKTALSRAHEDEIINKIRRDREKIWEERFAVRP